MLLRIRFLGRVKELLEDESISDEYIEKFDDFEESDDVISIMKEDIKKQLLNMNFDIT